ncbi:MAG: hypothetical protein LBV48_01250 [Mycoplasmataceae bacterium]|jgi:hypothetical protein|nr:hypothetical protein [Mycoplasmataceae bacterium]
MVKHFHSVSSNLSNHPFYRQTMIVLFMKFILIDITCLITGLCCIYLNSADWQNADSLNIIHAIGYVFLTTAIISILLSIVVTLGAIIICGCGNNVKDDASKKNTKKAK